MAYVEGRPTVSMEVTLTLSEAEAGALAAIFSYGSDAFLEVFYKHLGTSYLHPYASGVKSLHDTVPGQLDRWLKKAENARKTFLGGQ